eukprot:6188175-Pleurochrysis_carterae.AAC.1
MKRRRERARLCRDGRNMFGCEERAVGLELQTNSNDADVRRAGAHVTLRGRIEPGPSGRGWGVEEHVGGNQK